ncbi:MAG: hypothetical protein ACRC33_01345, partial [Gemmataceae bacterium]
APPGAVMPGPMPQPGVMPLPGGTPPAASFMPPAAPGTAPTPPTAATPDATPSAAGAAAGLAAAGAGASTVGGGGGEGGSGSLQSGAPNMFGDAFSSRPLSVKLPGGFRFVGQQSYTVFPQGPFAFTGTAGQTQLAPRTTTVEVGGVNVFLPNGISLVAPAPAVAPVGTRLPVAESQEITDAVQRQLTPAGQFVRFNGQSAAVVLVDGQGLFNASVNELYDTFEPFRGLAITLPNPSGGGVVGRVKVSEDNNPMPRDRFIFNADYFSQVPLTPSGVSVYRYVAGFEKTFLDQRASVELRVPFASSIDSTITADGVTARATQLGNVHVTLKGLFYASETLCVSAGAGVALPTGEDVRVRLTDGTDLAHIRNDAYIVTPYVAALFTPTDRLFAQLWFAWGIDANGNRTDVNATFNGLQRAGRITDQNLAQLDAHLGYWLYRAADESSAIQGIAPFTELHYNATVGDADVIRSGAFQIGVPGSLNELNLTVGATAQVGTNFLLSAGLVMPLRDNFDRTFDYQLGVRGTLFFGPTARSRAAGSSVSSF